MASLNQDEILREKWQAIKVDIKNTWSRLTDEELELVNGDFTALEGVLNQKYGTSTADIHLKLEELTASFRRNIKQDSETKSPRLEDERDGVRGTLRDQYRQF